MAITRRITVKQKDNTTESVAFLSDVTLDGITGSGLVTVTGDKDKVVSTDATKLTVGAQGDVKVVTPLEFASNTTPSVPANKLYNKDGQLYWGDKVVGVVSPGEVPVSQEAFDAHKGNSDTDAKHLTDAELNQLQAVAGENIASESWVSTNFADKDDFDGVSEKVDTIETNYIKTIKSSSTDVPVSVSFGMSVEPNTRTTSVSVNLAEQDSDTKALSGTGLVTGAQAQDAISAAVASGVEDAIAEYDETVIGAWTPESTITGTVKTAIEANAAKIAALEGNHFMVVDELPPVSEGKFNVIYLVPTEGDPTSKDEFILIEEGEPATRKWEQIGTTKVDLSNYFTKAETTSAISTAVGNEETRATAAEETLTTAVATADGKAVAAQTAVNNLKTLVGDLPDGATATNVVDYISEKAGADVTALSNTEDKASAADADSFVTVELDGTVGNHSLSVSTSNIAKASEVGAVTDLETSVKSTVVGAVNEVAGKASTAVQTVSSGDTDNIQITKSGTEVTIAPVPESTLADLLAYCAIAEV